MPAPAPDPTEFIPCPRCWLPAELLPPAPHEAFHRSRCPRGHENALIPSVLDHLRALAEPAQPGSAA
jgi:hypothetical protein